MKLLPTALLSSLLLASPGQAITTPYVDPVWRPFIMLAGDGDPVQAAERLQRIKQLQDTMLNNTQVDGDTQRFIDGMWRSMERFDLKEFYGLLPEQEGRQRSLLVRGEWRDDVYHYATVKKADARKAGEPLSLGDVRIHVAATHLQGMSHSNRYWLQGDVQAGVGASRWQIVRDAGAEILNMASYPPQRFVQLDAQIEAEMRQKIRQAYPLLGNKDVAFLVPLWHGFPNLANVLVSIATVEDVVVEADNEQGYQSYTAQLVLDQHKLRNRYPKLVSYLDRVGNLVESTIDIHDENGRLARIKVDSKQWRFTIETVLSFGGIVPVADGQPQLERIRHFRDEPVDLWVNIDSNLDVLGVRTHVRNLRAQMRYVPSADQVNLETHINVVPTVAVDGAFLGAVPTGLIDMLIPGNIASIITEFFTVACEGNGGQGIVARLSMRNLDTPGVSEARAEGSVLAIDNPFIKMGMRIVNTRMIPDDAASEEWRHLFFATQDAFYQDFDLFMQKRKL
jgi:hypothetical protein